MKRFLGVALVTLLTVPVSAIADTSVFTGYQTYQGLRLTEHLTVSKRSITSPSNYINARLPSNAAVDEIHASADRATLVAASSNTYFNDTCWSTPIAVADTGATLVPVRLWRNGWTAVPTYKRQLQGILADGVPIPSGWTPEACQGDSDQEGAFYSPALDKLWELWRIKPCDPASCDGFSYTASDGGRMSYVHANPGHWVNRTNGATYPSLPSDPAKRATFEDHTWGATAAKLPRMELEVTKEDVQAGVISHALAFQLPPKYILKGKVWPAQGYDGYATTGIPEGARFRMAPLTNCALTYRIASLVCAAVRDYGAVLTDRGGALAFYGTPGVHPLLGGVARSKLFADFPFGRMERLQVGSDANPTP